MTIWSKIEGRLERWLAEPRQLLIDGEWRDAVAGGIIDVLDPATGTIMGRVAEAGAADVDLAVQSARRAFDARVWRRLSADDRARILWRISELVEQNVDFIAELQTRESGMTIGSSRMHVGLVAEGWRYYAGLCRQTSGKTAPMTRSDAAALAYSIEEPVGVVAGISAWNAPLTLASWKCAPALAAGCAVVLKPAEDAPLSAIILAELMLEAGVPPGVVNVVAGYGDVAGQALCEHPDVDKVTFTGSTAVGKTILTTAAATLKRVTLELGGKSPFIIFADADMARVVPRAAMAICANTGQICVAGSRLLVERKAYDQVVEGVSRFVAGLRVGPGLDPATRMGPLISARQRDRVMGYVESGKREGAELIAGGEPVDGDGYFVKPTIFGGVKPDMRIVREEIFGPVLSVIPFDDEEEAVAIANDTDYGLAGYLWTNDHGRALRMAHDIRAGMILLNTTIFSGYEYGAGGFKQSGLGRENGPDALRSFQETKWVVDQMVHYS